MTIASLLALALQAAPPMTLAPTSPAPPALAFPGPAPNPAPPQPPTPDIWDTLPPLQLRRTAVDMTPLVRFVRGEVAAGRCAAMLVEANGMMTVRASVAALVAPDGSVRRFVPAAIGCPTVEQFTVGVIGRLATGNVRAPWPHTARWYRTGLTYSWPAPAAPRSPDAR